MPNKHNAPRRRYIPKMKFRVKNWAVGVAVLNRMLDAGRPDFVRRLNIAA